LKSSLPVVDLRDAWSFNLMTIHHRPKGFAVVAAPLTPAVQPFFEETHRLAKVKVLSKISHAKFRDALKKQSELFHQVPHETWHKPWVVNSRPVGSGERALKYLALVKFYERA
jgi:hypothetical protein